MAAEDPLAVSYCTFAVHSNRVASQLAAFRAISLRISMISAVAASMRAEARTRSESNIEASVFCIRERMASIMLTSVLTRSSR